VLGLRGGVEGMVELIGVVVRVRGPVVGFRKVRKCIKSMPCGSLRVSVF
jgi:hypothetical protein